MLLEGSCRMSQNHKRHADDSWWTRGGCPASECPLNRVLITVFGRMCRCGGIILSHLWHTLETLRGYIHIIYIHVCVHETRWGYTHTTHVLCVYLYTRNNLTQWSDPIHTHISTESSTTTTTTQRRQHIHTRRRRHRTRYGRLYGTHAHHTHCSNALMLCLACFL